MTAASKQIALCSKCCNMRVAVLISALGWWISEFNIAGTALKISEKSVRRNRLRNDA